MKKLTLNQTWSRCLAMWPWVVKQKKLRPDVPIWKLKMEWVKKFHPDETPYSDCYFCEYDNQYTHEAACARCPGVLVSKAFRCRAASYQWSTKPEAFLRKIKALNKKRLERRKKR